MKFDDGIFGLYSRLYENRREVELSLEDYLGKCSDDPAYYAGAAERMLRAIGEPVMVDTSQARLLARIDHYRLADCTQHPFGCASIVGRIVGAFAEVILEREFDLSPVLVQPRIESEDPIVKFHLSPQPLLGPNSRYPKKNGGSRRTFHPFFVISRKSW